MGNTLDTSWNLEQRLKQVECSQELKKEILRYIELSQNRFSRWPGDLSGLVYRGNLHYIEDNLGSVGLIDELRTENERIEQLINNKLV